MKAKLTRISSSHTILRTDEVIGHTENSPQVGKRFVMFADSLNPSGAFRHVSTSPVQTVEGISLRVMRFTTLNSVYEFEELA